MKIYIDEKKNMKSLEDGFQGEWFIKYFNHLIIY